MSKFVYIIHQPHPLSPPLLTRRGERDFIREALPLSYLHSPLLNKGRGQGDRLLNNLEEILIYLSDMAYTILMTK